jgi:hypothetical protein
MEQKLKKIKKSLETPRRRKLNTQPSGSLCVIENKLNTISANSWQAKTQCIIMDKKN